MIDHKQFCDEVMNLEDEDTPKYLKRPSEWHKMVWKEILRKLSLKFIRSTGEGGLRYQLSRADKFEHLRYLFLTEFFVEQPTQIQNLEICEIWVEKCFRSKGLIL